MNTMRKYLEILQRLDNTVFPDWERIQDISKISQSMNRYEQNYMDFVQNIQR